jgi:hypothetical protein
MKNGKIKVCSLKMEIGTFLKNLIQFIPIHNIILYFSGVVPIEMGFVVVVVLVFGGTRDLNSGHHAC